MTTLLFTCPTTLMKVQHWLAGGEDTPDDEYEAVVCKACARVNFINRKTGKLLDGKKGVRRGRADDPVQPTGKMACSLPEPKGAR